MPFVSRAHKRKIEQLLAAGQITKAQYAEMEKGTPEDHSLPERVASDEPDAPAQTKKKTVSPFW